MLGLESLLYLTLQLVENLAGALSVVDYTIGVFENLRPIVQTS